MSATDGFSWLPDWQYGIDIKYKHDTVINASETGNEQSRIPLLEKMKRTLTCKHFSPDYLTNIENFLRKMHADFFQIPIFSEPIIPIGVFGSNLKNVAVVTCEDITHHWNLNNLCSNILMVSLQNQNVSELHSLNSKGADWFMINGPWVLDFYLGNTVYFPVMSAYNNQIADTLLSTQLIDTDLIFEEYF
jgi:hypothetical protein